MAYQNSARPATQCDKSCDFHLAMLFFEGICAAKCGRKGGNLYKKDSCAGREGKDVQEKEVLGPKADRHAGGLQRTRSSSKAN